MLNERQERFCSESRWDFAIAPGVYPDMREHGAGQDDWPILLERVMAAEILVIGTSIWLGDKTSVTTRVIEGRRLPVRLSEPGLPLRPAPVAHEAYCSSGSGVRNGRKAR